MTAILITNCEDMYVCLFQRFTFQNTKKYKLTKWNNDFVFIQNNTF